MWKVEERKEAVPASITLPSLDEELQAELHQRYEEAADGETRTRYLMIVLAQSGHTAPHIARLVLRSEDTVERVLKRFHTGGLDAVPRWSAPGRERTATSAWEGELLRMIELDPHEVGQETANWTTGLLADYLGRHTGVTVSLETVRVYLHAHGYVCKRPTWTLRAPYRRESGLRGKRLRVEVLLAGAQVPQHPNLYPFMIWSRLICGVSFPPTCQRCSRFCQVQTSISKMRCRLLFTRRVSRVWCRKGRRGQRMPRSAWR